MADILSRVKTLLPSRRKLIQLYAFLLYNAHIKGFVSGNIYTGPIKAMCVPGLNCYSCPGAVGACPLGALQNAIAASGHTAPFYVLGILVLYGLIFGRTVCGFLCPFGLIQELIHKLPTPKIKKSRITHLLSHLKYVILIVFSVLLPLYSAVKAVPLPAFCKYICPAGTLEGAVALLINPANADKFSMLHGLFTWKFVVLILIILLCVFIYRAFCRFLCPLGAVYALFNRFCLVGTRVDEHRCTGCGKCVSHCKMDVRNVGDRECIQCGSCISACPVGAISIKAGKITLKAPETKSANRKDTLIKRALIVFSLLILVLVLALSNLPDKSEFVRNPKDEIAEILPVGSEPGMRAPDFTAPVYSEGGEITLSSLRGKTVVLNFWATWCAPCVKELPHFEGIHLSHPEDTVVIALHSSLVTEDVQAYLDKAPYTFLFAFDANNTIIPSFGGSNMLPQTVVIDKNGIITYNAVGSVTYETLEQLISAANP